MIWIIRDILICLFRLYMLDDLEKNMLPYRIESYKCRMGIDIVASIVICIINMQESTLLNVIMVPTFYILISFIFFEGSLWKKLIISCCFYMLAIVPEFMFAVVTNAYGISGNSNGFHNEFEKTVAIILMKLVTFLLIKCINQVNRKRHYIGIENRTFSVLLMLPMATIAILVCMYYAHIPFTGKNRIILSIGALLLLIANIFIFSVFDRLVENGEKIKKMERLYQKSLAENNNLKYLAKLDNDYKTLLHDINKFVRTAGTLMQKDQKKDALEIMEQLGMRIQEVKEYQYTSHILLNSILCERKFAADNMNIEYQVMLSSTLEINFIDDLDLISIVGNLLDNAIEAAGKVKDGGFVKCKMYMANSNHFLMMEFANDYLIPPQMGKHGYISRKREPENHGIGLHTVEQLVKKYSGIMKIEVSGNIFKVLLMFTVMKQ